MDLNFDFSALDWLARWSLSHLNAICLAMTTTLIAIYGQDVNRWVKRRLAGRHLLFRTAVFVFICAFGYGWCILKAAPKFAWLLRQLPTRSLPVVLLLIFVALGAIAERRRHI
ncbi:MAG: DUF3392 domain-containing protein [Bradymonadia bacterium]